MALTRPDEERASRLSRGAVLAAALSVLLVLAAYVVGRNQPRVHAAEVGCHAAAGLISCELPDGWTVAVPRDVGWTSASGTAHEGGRPACLPPTGDVGPVELSWVPVTTDGRSWRQVVWVTC